MGLIKIFLCGSYNHYLSWFKDLVEIVDLPEEADVIFFGGGTDISSIIYNAFPSAHSDFPDVERDNYEVDIWNRFKRRKKFIGVCRGAQLLGALNGANLYQHLMGHDTGLIQDVITKEGYRVGSSHHQGVIANTLPEDVTVYFKEFSARKGIYYDFETEDFKTTDEIDLAEVFEGKNFFAIQGHPEYADTHKNTIETLRQLLINFFNK